MNTCLDAQNLSYRYSKNIEALKNVSFKMPAGKICALLGPNGSGKSTTFKILSTQIQATEGDASIFGYSIKNSAQDVRKQIGVSFQSPSLDPLLSIDENLQIQASLYQLSSKEAAKRIEVLLKALGITDRRATRVAHLSGGLARRAELAKTLIAEPKLLLLDEPTTGLDPLARLEFWKLLTTLKQNHLSILVTTHLMEEAENCDYLYFLKEGELVAEGAPSDLKAAFGFEVVLADLKNLDASFKSIQEKLEPKNKVFLQNSKLRVETKNPIEVFEFLRTTFKDEIGNISIGKPTLADVYFSKTGKTL